MKEQKIIFLLLIVAISVVAISCDPFDPFEPKEPETWAKAQITGDKVISVKKNGKYTASISKSKGNERNYIVTWKLSDTTYYGGIGADFVKLKDNNDNTCELEVTKGNGEFYLIAEIDGKETDRFKVETVYIETDKEISIKGTRGSSVESGRITLMDGEFIELNFPEEPSGQIYYNIFSMNEAPHCSSPKSAHKYLEFEKIRPTRNYKEYTHQIYRVVAARVFYGGYKSKELRVDVTVNFR